VAFVLDLSSGDLDLIYRVSLPFIRRVADGLPLRPDRVRLAFVTAVDTPTVQFYFNTYRYVHCVKGAVTSHIKQAIKRKTSPARFAQLLQPSLAFCFSLKPITAYRHWLQAKTKC